MNKQLRNRRNFNGLRVALGSSLSSVGAMTVALSSASARAAPLTVKFHDGTIVPALGQGSANLGQGRYPEAAEEEALRTGFSLGMNLIDTAEMYGQGQVERLVGGVIAGQRDRVFLVSKVSPNHVTGTVSRGLATQASPVWHRSSRSLPLHWPTRTPTFQTLWRRSKAYARRKISAWGVSNFKVSDMEDLFRVSHGDRCATNQVLYNLGNRDIQ
jgi:diketogulonate reductase-like aldo/keto reductase